MNEKTSTASSPETLNVYSPSTLVTVPFCVPFSTIFTPGSNSPEAPDVTFPLTTTCCLSLSEAGVITIRLFSSIAYLMSLSARILSRTLLIVEFFTLMDAVLSSIVSFLYRNLKSVCCSISEMILTMGAFSRSSVSLAVCE